MNRGKNKSVYLSGLNGIRSIAAGAVLLTHLNMAMPQFGMPALFKSHLADYGVTMFFALSGFLITYLLLLEKEKTQKIALGKFYMRRILRIWPLYFLYIGLAIVVILCFDLEFSWPVLGFLMIFASNIPAVNQDYFYHTHHYWSLGVEEQFYAFWPLLLKLLKKPGTALIGFLVVFLAFKVAFRIIDHEGFAYNFLYRTRFDCMAIGGLGAWIYKNHYAKWLKTLVEFVPVQLICWAGIALAAVNLFRVPPLFSHEVFAGITVVIIFNAVSNPKPLIQLENKLMDFLGGISFGLYVYHPLAIFLMAWLIKPLEMNFYLKFGLVYLSVCGITVLASHLSYQYIEKPFLRIKHRFSVVLSRSRMGLKGIQTDS